MQRLVDCVNKPSIGVLIGGNGAGKSFMLRYLMYKRMQSKRQRIIIFTKVEFNGDFAFVPRSCFYPCSEEGVKAAMVLVEANTAIPTLFVFDDSGMNFRSDYMKGLIGRIRHYNITILITGRTDSQIPVDARRVAQYACLFKCTNKDTLKQLYDDFGQEVDSKEEFFAMMRDLKKHEALFYCREDETPYAVVKASAVPDDWVGFHFRPTKAPGKPSNAAV